MLFGLKRRQDVGYKRQYKEASKAMNELKHRSLITQLSARRSVMTCDLHTHIKAAPQYRDESAF